MDGDSTSVADEEGRESDEGDIIDANRPETIPDADVADKILSESARRSLRAEALSVEHQLHHKPKNPYCQACCYGKMKHKKKMKGSFKPCTRHWGEHLTADHITSVKDNMLGVSGDRDALVVKDIHSGLKHLYPTKTKTALDTERRLKEFVGPRNVDVLYSDRSGEINLACRNMRILPFNSQPGMPQNNAVIERTNQDLLAGVRCNLEQAGLPACFWPMAGEHFCVVDNTSDVVHAPGETPWMKTHGKHFAGERWPLGCAVVFKPNDTQNNGNTGLGEHLKMKGDTLDGVFGGYELGPGYTWHGLYRVWALADFVDVDLSVGAKVMSQKFWKPHLVKAVELPKRGVHFP